MKKALLFISILILNLSSYGQIISKFAWDGPLADLKKAANGPDAVSVSSGALASVINIIGGVTNAGISPGLVAKDIDLTLPNTAYFNVPSIDLSIDFRREESEASFVSRGSLFDFGMSGGKLSVKFNVDNGIGGNTTINSGTVYDIPNDHLFHTYRFTYNNITGVASMSADGLVKYTYNGIANRSLYWTGAGSPMIGNKMDATGRNVAVLDNFAMSFAPNPIILPLKFTSFSANTKGQGVELKWTTANEVNVKQFVVEKSSDGATFKPLATIQAQGPATFENHYVAADELSNHNVSYRIKSVDLDGKVNYTVTKTIFAGTNVSMGVNVFPNPAIDVVNLSFNNSADAKYAYSIYTPDGRCVQSGAQVIAKGAATVVITFNSSIPHNAILTITLTNNQNKAIQSARIFRK